MKILVTGAAGFIGSNLVDRLLERGDEVVGVDNFSTGREEFLSKARDYRSFKLFRGDLLDLESLREPMRGVEFVFHLAANADVRFGTQHPRKDLEQNTIATWNVLETMRACDVRRVAFSSTGSVYGEPSVFPTPEDCPFSIQTSLYGASKLAAEGLIQAYAEGFGIVAWVFRFVSILGERYSHGHVRDFFEQLREHPDILQILGDGRQRKSYLYVQDCIDAILLAAQSAGSNVNTFNLGTDEYCEVDESAAWISGRLGVSPAFVHGGGTRGWVGDSPFIFLDCSRIRALGWRPKLSIREAVIRTVDYLTENSWLFETSARRQAAG